MYQVVIVDDEQAVLRLIAKYIDTTAGYRVIGSFCEGAAAMEFLRGHDADVLISDISMPGVTGLDLAQFVHDQMPQCAVVFISGYSRFDYAQKAIALDVVEYLCKPIRHADIESVLRRVHERAIGRYYEQRANRDWRAEYDEFFRRYAQEGFEGIEAFRAAFGRARFPFPIRGQAGQLLRVTTERETEGLAAMVRSVACTEWPGSHLYRAAEADGGLYFVLIAPGGRAFADHIVQVMRRVWNCQAQVEVALAFEDFEQLAEFPLAARSCDSPPSSAREDAGEDDPVIRAAKAYILSHLGEDLTRGWVAQQVYMSSDYFSRYFHKKTGESYFQFVQRARIKRATELLKTGMRVQEIREKVGYRNRKFFGDVFRAYNGCTPSEYRRTLLLSGSEDEQE